MALGQKNGNHRFWSMFPCTTRVFWARCFFLGTHSHSPSCEHLSVALPSGSVDPLSKYRCLSWVSSRWRDGRWSFGSCFGEQSINTWEWMQFMMKSFCMFDIGISIKSELHLKQISTVLVISNSSRSPYVLSLLLHPFRDHNIRPSTFGMLHNYFAVNSLNMACTCPTSQDFQIHHDLKSPKMSKDPNIKTNKVYKPHNKWSFHSPSTVQATLDQTLRGNVLHFSPTVGNAWCLAFDRILEKLSKVTGAYVLRTGAFRTVEGDSTNTCAIDENLRL